MACMPISAALCRGVPQVPGTAGRAGGAVRAACAGSKACGAACVAARAHALVRGQGARDKAVAVARADRARDGVYRAGRCTAVSHARLPRPCCWVQARADTPAKCLAVAAGVQVEACFCCPSVRALRVTDTGVGLECEVLCQVLV